MNSLSERAVCCVSSRRMTSERRSSRLLPWKWRSRTRYRTAESYGRIRILVDSVVEGTYDAGK